MELNACIMHHLFLWIESWEVKDFKIAFKSSQYGWECYWAKYQENLFEDKCRSLAIIKTVLNMDNLHQTLLLDYIINVKYRKSIAIQITNIKSEKKIN